MRLDVVVNAVCSSMLIWWWSLAGQRNGLLVVAERLFAGRVRSIRDNRSVEESEITVCPVGDEGLAVRDEASSG